MSNVQAVDRNIMDTSEREQCRAAIHGDREAFEMIIRTQSRTLLRSLTAFANREEAEDVVQDSLAWKMRREGAPAPSSSEKPIHLSV